MDKEEEDLETQAIKDELTPIIFRTLKSLFRANVSFCLEIWWSSQWCFTIFFFECVLLFDTIFDSTLFSTLFLTKFGSGKKQKFSCFCNDTNDFLICILLTFTGTLFQTKKL